MDTFLMVMCLLVATALGSMHGHLLALAYNANATNEVKSRLILLLVGSFSFGLAACYIARH